MNKLKIEEFPDSKPKKTSNCPSRLKSPSKKKSTKKTVMENGLFFKIGLNALLLVEEENNSFKEFANPLLEMEPLVKKDPKFCREIATNNLAPNSVPTENPAKPPPK